MSTEGPLFDAARHVRRLAGGRATDGELLERFAGTRDEAAFEEIVRRHGPAVRRLCRRVLRSDHDAEDAFQAAFLVLARKAGSVRRGQALAAWLYRVAYRIAVEARGAARQRSERERAMGVGPDGAEAPAAPDAVGLMAEAVAHLPERYRAAVVLCYLEGHSSTEAARALGWPVGTVKASLSRARERLRRWLERHGIALGPALLAPEVGVLHGGEVEALAKLAVGYAGGAGVGVSPPVLVLTEGALRAMGTTKLKWALAGVMLVGVCGSALALWPGRPRELSPVVRPPVPEKQAELFPGEQRTLGIRARGRVVFSADGKRMAWQQGGQAYVADLADVIKAGQGRPRARAVTTTGMKQEYLDGVLVPGGLVAVTPRGLVGPGVLLRDGKPAGLSPDGKWLAVSRPKDVVLMPVGARGEKSLTVAGVTFGCWSAEGASAYVVTRSGLDVRRVTVPGGETVGVIDGSDLAQLCGEKIGGVSVVSARGSGQAERVFLVAEQQAPQAAGLGTYVFPVPKGAVKRGANPGSAEPGPAPPTWSILHAGGKSRVLSVDWRARYLDEAHVLPSAKLDRFFFAQMAQKGGAQDGRDAEVWLGQIDEAGKKVERKVEKAFPPTMRDVRWTVLDWSDDATRALVFVACNLELRVPAADDLALGAVAMKYNRGGAKRVGQEAVLKFQGWSLWSFDATKAGVKQLTKLYGERQKELGQAVVGVEGKLLSFGSYSVEEHVAYSRRAGVVAVSLNTQSPYGDMRRESLAPVVLLRVPRW